MTIRLFLILVFGLSGLSTFGQCEWNYLDTALVGDDIGDHFGKALAVSEDGATIAVGAPLFGTISSSVGLVRVYKLNGNKWQQKGQDIKGSSSNLWLGSSVAMSASGDTIIIGSIYSNFGGQPGRGRARVYRYNGSSWVTLGSSIHGENRYDYFGVAVDISPDGKTIAVGGDYNDGASGSESGTVEVYKLSGTNWSQLGSDIDGEKAGDFSGKAISLSDNGEIIAIGAARNDDAATFSGHVRVFKLDSGQWVQMGSDIDGMANDRLGESVSLSGDGSLLAIGLPFTNNIDSGSVRFFGYNDSIWVKVTEPIVTDSFYDRTGISVMLSTNGQRIAVGSYGSHYGDSLAGKMEMFERKGDHWVLAANPLSGDSAVDCLGYRVALSGDGATMLGGAYFLNNYSNEEGYVKVYKFDSLINYNPDSISISSCLPYTTNSGRTMSTTGYYSDTLSTSTACDSVVIINFKRIQDSIPPTLLGKTDTLYLNTIGEAATNLARINDGTYDNCLLDTLYINKDSFSCSNIGKDSTYLVGIDFNGNIDSLRVFVHVLDIIRPRARSRQSRIYLDSTGIATLTPDSLDRGSTDNCLVDSFALSKTQFNCDELGLHSIWFKVYDQSGNVDSIKTAVWVLDSLSERDTLTILECHEYDNGYGHIWESSGLYTDTFSSWNGCDSVVFYDLTILNEFIDTNFDFTASSYDYLGMGLATSPDGKTVAIGQSQLSTGSGSVKVYRQSSGQWLQLGQSLVGEASRDAFGYSVSLSGDGNILAVSAPWNDGNGNTSGHVRVFELDNGSWVQMGADIDGDTIYERSGLSIDLSDNGLVLAVGAPDYLRNGDYVGKVKLYSFNGSSWYQIGDDLIGAAGDHFGYSVSLSKIGTTVAIGAPGQVSWETDSSYVEVYQYISAKWIRKGQILFGDTLGDKAGYELSLSANGNRLAIGYPGHDSLGVNAGIARVFSYSSGSWSQEGGTLAGEQAGDQFGQVVQLSPNGQLIMVSAPRSSKGYIKAYNFDGSQWNQRLNTIYGDAVGDIYGFRIAVSNDPNVYAISSPYAGQGFNSGLARIYKTFTRNDDAIETQNAYLCNGQFTARSGKLITTLGTHLDTFSNSLGCDSIYKYEIKTQVNTSAYFDTTVCESYYSPSGKLLHESGYYYDTIASKLVGCDSLISFQLTINVPSSDTIIETVCGSYSSPSGKLFTTSGQYFDTLLNHLACDSFISIQLEVNQHSFSQLDLTGCQRVQTPSGQWYYQSGMYHDTINNSLGCDSIISLDVSIHPNFSKDTAIQSCDSFISGLGNIWTSSGIYIDTFTTAEGCDSIWTYDLTISSSFYEQSIVSVCDSFVSPSGKSWYQSGWIRDSLITISGCDSVYDYNLTVSRLKIVSQPKDTIVLEGDTASFIFIVESNQGVDYLWQVDSGTGFVNLSEDLYHKNVDSNVLKVVNSHSSLRDNQYRCIVQADECRDSSNSAKLYVRTARVHNSKLLNMEVYPNPSEGEIQLDLDRELSRGRVRILDSQGNEVSTRFLAPGKNHTIKLELAAGIYFLEVSDSGRWLSVLPLIIY